MADKLVNPRRGWWRHELWGARRCSRCRLLLPSPCTIATRPRHRARARARAAAARATQARSRGASGAERQMAPARATRQSGSCRTARLDGRPGGGPGGGTSGGASRGGGPGGGGGGGGGRRSRRSRTRWALVTSTVNSFTPGASLSCVEATNRHSLRPKPKPKPKASAHASEITIQTRSDGTAQSVEFRER
eukprot:SAG11_NODE_2019_length_3914_cov_2.546908_3_plen_191_part_00